MSDSLWPHGRQYTRLPYPSLTLRAYSHWCPLSWWCHPTISSSVIPFSFCLQSFPASRSFPMIQLFASGGQSIGASASTSVLSMNIKGWFPLGWTGLMSLQSKGLSRVFSSTTNRRHQLFGAQPSLRSNSHIHTWSLRMCPCMLSRFSHVQLFVALWTIRSPLGSSVHGIFQAWILVWVATPSSRVSSRHWGQTWIYFSCIGRRILYH